jgi:hypothetical protein
MIDLNSPAWTLAGSTGDLVWADRHDVSMPVVVAIDADGTVTTHPHPQADAGTVRLVPSLSDLTGDTVLDLLEMLIAIPGVRPAEIPIGAHDDVSVPLLRPSTVADDRVEWTITDQLSITHADRRDVYFAVAGDRSVVELSAPQTWQLIRALTTVRCWQFELEIAFAAAATQLRAGLRSIGTTMSATAATSSTAPGI